MNEQERRREAFAKLLERFGQSPTDYDEGGEEDPRPYLAGYAKFGRFVCVTMHDGKNFFLPEFDSADEAFARAIEYVNDDIWEEIPVAVYDLDMDQTSRPLWSTLRWSAWA